MQNCEKSTFARAIYRLTSLPPAAMAGYLNFIVGDGYAQLDAGK
jgi:hypothetical protein